uniref:Uncharacterized protein n=1 Tax=Rhizophora mucronata TaxID=61149 RepID=A0A2P2QWN6_RHIMU
MICICLNDHKDCHLILFKFLIPWCSQFLRSIMEKLLVKNSTHNYEERTTFRCIEMDLDSCI